MTNGGQKVEAKLAQILLAGAGGGVLFWALCFYKGGLPGGSHAPLPWNQWLWASLLLCAILGAGAGAFGVWLADTNREDWFRCIVFAAICGFAWEPTLSGVFARLTREYQDPKVQQALKETEEALKGSARPPTGPPSPTDASPPLPPTPSAPPSAPVATPAPQVPDVARAAEGATLLIENLHQVQNPTLRLEAKQKVIEAASAVKAAAERDPAGADQALRKMREAAKATGQSDLLKAIGEKGTN